MLPRPYLAGVVVLVTAAAAVPAGATEVTVHGSVSQGYLQSSEYNYLTPETEAGTFSFNEMLVNVTGRVDDRTRIGLQFLGRDLGPQGNGDVIVDWAFGDYRWRDGLGFRIGKLKTPLGLYGKTRDVDAVRTSVLLPQGVYSETLRGVTTAVQGAGVYGNLKLGGPGSLDYEVCVGSVEMGSSRFLQENLAAVVAGAPMLSYAVENRLTVVAQAIWNLPVEGLRVAGTWARSRIAADGTFALGQPTPWSLGLDVEAPSIVVLSADYNRDALSLAAEFTRYDVDLSFDGVPWPDGQGGLTPVSVTSTDQRGGYYAQGAYRLGTVVEMGAYYSVFHPDWNDRDGAAASPEHRAWQDDLALTARFDVTENWILKLEGHLIDGTGDLVPEYNPGGFDAGSWNLFAAKATFSF